jgi:hypothetical protein
MPVNSRPPVATTRARLRLAESYMGTSGDQSEDGGPVGPPSLRNAR